MSTTTSIALAVEIAERFMSDQGYRHGPCLAAKTTGPESTAHWEVEFAYEGLVSRSATSGPPSIRLAVDLNREEVKPIELM